MLWAPSFTRLDCGAGTIVPTLLFQCGGFRRHVACADAREDRHVVCTTPGKRMGEEEDRGGRNVEGEGGLKAARPPFPATRPSIIPTQTCLQWKTTDDPKGPIYN